MSARRPPFSSDAARKASDDATTQRAQQGTSAGNDRTHRYTRGKNWLLGIDADALVDGTRRGNMGLAQPHPSESGDEGARGRQPPGV